MVAVGVIPYPPGIPIVMPGESMGPADGPWLTYLRTLQEYGHLFPGFAKEVEGTEERDGVYHIYCVKECVRADVAVVIEYAATTRRSQSRPQLSRRASMQEAHTPCTCAVDGRIKFYTYVVQK